MRNDTNHLTQNNSDVKQQTFSSIVLIIFKNIQDGRCQPSLDFNKTYGIFQWKSNKGSFSFSNKKGSIFWYGDVKKFLWKQGAMEAVMQTFKFGSWFSAPHENEPPNTSAEILNISQYAQSLCQFKPESLKMNATANSTDELTLQRV